jgi:hypothetical protein
VFTYVLWCLRLALLFGSVFVGKADVGKANQDSSLQPGDSPYWHTSVHTAPMQALVSE